MFHVRLSDRPCAQAPGQSILSTDWLSSQTRFNGQNEGYKIEGFDAGFSI
jgi:hypothetical protein